MCLKQRGEVALYLRSSSYSWCLLLNIFNIWLKFFNVISSIFLRTTSCNSTEAQHWFSCHLLSHPTILILRVQYILYTWGFSMVCVALFNCRNFVKIVCSHCMISVFKIGVLNYFPHLWKSSFGSMFMAGSGKRCKLWKMCFESRFWKFLVGCRYLLPSVVHSTVVISFEFSAPGDNNMC